MIDEVNPEVTAPLAVQFIDIDPFLHTCPGIHHILPAATRGQPEAQEIRRHQAPPAPGRRNERFHQPETIAIASLEILRQTPQDAPEHMAGEMQADDTGTDQETVEANHPVEMRLTLLIAPVHPPVAHRKSQRCGGKSGRSQNAMGRPDKIVDLAAGKGRDSLRMLVGDQRVPGPAVCPGGDRHDIQILNLLKPVRNLLHRRYRGLENMRTRTNRWCLWRWQSDQFRTCLQSSERLQTPCQLRTTPRIEETELIAKPTPDRVTTDKTFLRKDPGDAGSRRRIAKRAGNLILCQHATNVGYRVRIVQSRYQLKGSTSRDTSQTDPAPA